VSLGEGKSLKQFILREVAPSTKEEGDQIELAVDSLCDLVYSRRLPVEEADKLWASLMSLAEDAL
jgi:hypothetical protein